MVHLTSSLAMQAAGLDELVLSNRLEELDRLALWAETQGARLRLPAKTAFRLDLVLNEAVTNIISYAYNDRENHLIVVRLFDREDSITIELSDDGKPFNPLTFYIPEQGADLASASIGGRGIMLIKCFTQQQEYRYVEGRNVLKLILSKIVQHPESALSL